MSEKKVKLKDQLGRVVRLDDGASGATLGKNLFGPDGKLLTAAQIINPPADQKNAVPTLWKLIREIPANIRSIALLVGTGFAARRTSGEWALRTLQEGTGIEITNPGGDAGDPTIGLEDLANSGAGALVAITRDAKGRVSGTRAASTTDLAEGTNLYFTNARADARIAAQKGQPNGLAPLGPDSLIPTAYLPPLALTDVSVVSSQAAQLALVAQEGDVAVRTDISKNYIHNGGTTGTMADWTELLTPAAPVQSVNGQTGNVTLTAANVGAATTAQGAKADSAVQSIVAGTGVTVNNADPRNPIVSATGGGGGAVSSVNARTGAVVVPDFVQKATAPVSADFGRAIIDGDRWFNTTNGVDYTWVAGAWVHDNAASLSRYVPAYLASGAASPIPLNADGTIPAYLADGTYSPIPTQA